MRLFRFIFLGGVALLPVMAMTAWANSPSEPERLSEWLLKQPAKARDSFPWLVLKDPALIDRQAYLKRELLVDFFPNDSSPPEFAVRQRFSAWLENLPVTGRIPVLLPDPRWLQAHPAQDPILEKGREVTLVERPLGITVIRLDGDLCHITHRTGSDATAYLEACLGKAQVLTIDEVYIVQPDGRVRRQGLARWNHQGLEDPGPGAWIWAPPRGVEWAQRISDRLTAFLATQGPAVDFEVNRFQVPQISGEPDIQAPVHSANDWGFIGLMQTPTARMAAAGDMRFHYSRVAPYGRGSVILQPLDWLEAGFRYTNISNRLYGPNIAGDQAYKDKSIDFKIKLWNESARVPEVALGVIDIGGTGLFSGEYVVASKRTGDWDWSLGLGWGYLGGRGDIRNPLSLLGKKFEDRPAGTTSTGGTINSNAFFRGSAALFGGVEVASAWDGLSFKAELDGNNYQREPQSNNQIQRSSINVGLVYQMNSGANLTLGVERGNTLMLGFTLHGGVDRLVMPKKLDPKIPTVIQARPTVEPDWQRTATDLDLQTNWRVSQIERAGGELRVTFDDNGGVYWMGRLDRIAAVLHRDAPAEIDRFLIVHRERGLILSSHRIDRDTWVAQKTRHFAFGRAEVGIDPLSPEVSTHRASLNWMRSDDKFQFGLAPSFSQNIGGPNGFILFQAGVATPFEFRFSQATWLSGASNLRLVDNYNKFKYTAPSNLPRVRTYLREYLTTSTLTLPNLQLNHVGEAARNQYYSIYAGYLESMFAGVGAEWLYRPWYSHLAFGVDINRVRQRAFEQDFNLRNYEVTTGHATLYWDTRWKGVQVKLSGGQYLAGDRGATLDVSRTFANGVTVGAYASKTNVPTEVFGEGSFDKGIYVAIPFDAMLMKSSPLIGNFVWNPLTRDGGAKLGRANPLYALTGPRSQFASEYRPASDVRREEVPIAGPESVLRDVGGSLLDIGGNFTQGDVLRGVMLGTGMVLASSIVDRAGDRWALNHAGGKWETLAKAANGIPLALGLGTGLLWTGIADDYAADTAWTAFKAVGVSLGVQYGAKYAIGRARPELNLGSRNFSSGANGASDSSLPSGHMTAAFAFVTPFAQRYGAPWLYGVAVATAYGRIQQRKHWVSDTVAGSLLGYGIASLINDHDRRRRNAPQISIGPDRHLAVEWQF